MTTEELFGRCVELAKSEPGVVANRFMHETLVLCCAQGLKAAGTGFGNLFSQVDYLAKRRGMTTAERMAVQQMRRHSNHSEVPSREVWMQDVRALALFISAVCQADVPDELLRLIPHHQSLAEAAPSVDLRYRRCIVGRWDENTIDAETSDGGKVAGFQLAGADGKFAWAEAEIAKDNIAVTVPDGMTPAKVRYAWDDFPVCNLVNAEGLPCGPFELDVR